MNIDDEDINNFIRDKEFFETSLNRLEIFKNMLDDVNIKHMFATMRDYYKNIYKKGFRNKFIKIKIYKFLFSKKFIRMNNDIFKQIIFSTKEQKDIFIKLIDKLTTILQKHIDMYNIFEDEFK